MLTLSQVRAARERAVALLNRAGIVLTVPERETLEVVDFGLGELERTGLELVTYINTDRYCAKELVLFPRQTCAEHRHPPLGERPGKMETFRCRWGKVWLYIDGPRSANINGRPPAAGERCYTVFHEIGLTPGMQYTIPSNTLHWFQAGDEGAVVSEFSSPSHDDSDVFTDKRIERMPRLKEE